MPDNIKGINTLKICPPGFKREILIPFPEGKLPVCQECKVICSTRDACRVTKKHTGRPWSTSWVCIVVDKSVSPNGDSNIVSGEYFVSDLNPFGFQNHFVGSFDENMPVCQHCKKTNRTKHYCRTKHGHGAVPWNASVIHLSLNEDPLRDSPSSEMKVESGGITLPASYTFLVEVSTHVVQGRPLIIAPPGSNQAKKIRAQNKAAAAAAGKPAVAMGPYGPIKNRGGKGKKRSNNQGERNKNKEGSTKNIYGVAANTTQRKKRKTKEIYVDTNDTLENVSQLSAVHVADKLRIHWQGKNSNLAPDQSVYIPPGYSPYTPIYPMTGFPPVGYPPMPYGQYASTNSNDEEGGNILAGMGKDKSCDKNGNEGPTGYPYVPQASSSISKLLRSAESSKGASPNFSSIQGDPAQDALKLFSIGQNASGTATPLTSGVGLSSDNIFSGVRNEMPRNSSLDVIANAMNQIENRNMEEKGENVELARINVSKDGKDGGGVEVVEEKKMSEVSSVAAAAAEAAAAASATTMVTTTTAQTANGRS